MKPVVLSFPYAYAERFIFDTYKKNVSIIGKAKPLNKYGQNLLVGTANATIMTLPSGETEETLLATNGVTHVSSSDNGDSGNVLVEGHYIDGNGDLVFTIQTVVLTGQTIAAFTQPLARVTRSRTLDFVPTGSLYFHEGNATAGVPAVAAEIHMIQQAGETGSQKASTSISGKDFWIINQIYGGFLKKQAGFAQVRLEAKLYTSTVWLPYSEWIPVSSSDSKNESNPEPFIIIPSNYDVRLVANADAASTAINGGMRGYLAEVVEDYS